MSEQTKAEKLAEEYRLEQFKVNPDGFTVAPYVNAEVLDDAFMSGRASLQAELDEAIEVIHSAAVSYGGIVNGLYVRDLACEFLANFEKEG